MLSPKSPIQPPKWTVFVAAHGMIQVCAACLEVRKQTIRTVLRVLFLVLCSQFNTLFQAQERVSNRGGKISGISLGIC